MRFRIEIARQGSATVNMSLNQSLAQAHNGRVQPTGTQLEPLPRSLLMAIGMRSPGYNRLYRSEAARDHSGHSSLCRRLPQKESFGASSLTGEHCQAGISRAFRLRLCPDEISSEFRREDFWVKAVSVVRPTDVSGPNPNNVGKAPGKCSAACPEPESSLGPISVAAQLCNTFTECQQANRVPIDFENFMPIANNP
jgi:hypothetical protein